MSRRKLLWKNKLGYRGKNPIDDKVPHLQHPSQCGGSVEKVIGTLKPNLHHTTLIKIESWLRR